MIILIAIESDGKRIVSHGIDIETGKVVIVPQNPLSSFDCYLNRQIGEYILKEDNHGT